MASLQMVLRARPVDLSDKKRIMRWAMTYLGL
jgi:hypothetical protein